MLIHKLDYIYIFIYLFRVYFFKRRVEDIIMFTLVGADTAKAYNYSILFICCFYILFKSRKINIYINNYLNWDWGHEDSHVTWATSPPHFPIVVCADGERRIMETAGFYLDILRFLNKENPTCQLNNPFLQLHSPGSAGHQLPPFLILHFNYFSVSRTQSTFLVHN